MQMGFIGFGKMGSRMVQKLLADGHDVVGWNRSQEAIKNLKSQISNLPAGEAGLKSASKNLKTAKSIEDLISQLQKPRVIWLMLPAGEATESVLQEVARYVDVEEGDIIID